MRHTTHTRPSGSRKALVIGLVGGPPASGVASAAAALDGRGDRGHWMGGMGGEQFVERMAEHIYLTGDQFTGIRGVMDETRDERRAMRDRPREARRQLHDATESESFDESAFQALADSLGDAMTEMIMLRAKVRSRTRDVLTDEQRERLQLYSERRGRCGRGK